MTFLISSWTGLKEHLSRRRLSPPALTSLRHRRRKGERTSPGLDLAAPRYQPSDLLHRTRLPLALFALEVYAAPYD